MVNSTSPISTGSPTKNGAAAHPPADTTNKKIKQVALAIFVILAAVMILPPKVAAIVSVLTIGYIYFKNPFSGGNPSKTGGTQLKPNTPPMLNLKEVERLPNDGNPAPTPRPNHSDQKPTSTEESNQHNDSRPSNQKAKKPIVQSPSTPNYDSDDSSGTTTSSGSGSGSVVVHDSEQPNADKSTNISEHTNDSEGAI